MAWRRQWHPTPVLLPGKSHEWWFMGLQRVGHDWATELNWRVPKGCTRDFFYPGHILDNISQPPLQLGDIWLHLACRIWAKVMTVLLSSVLFCLLLLLVLTLRETMEAAQWRYWILFYSGSLKDCVHHCYGLSCGLFPWKKLSFEGLTLNVTLLGCRAFKGVIKVKWSLMVGL